MNRREPITYPTPVKIAAVELTNALRFQTVLTIETVEAALYEHVYKLWEQQGMFDGPESIGCEFCGAHPTEPCTTGEGPCFWRYSNWRRARNEATEHETHAEFAAPMVNALRDAAIDRRTEAGL